MFFNTISFFIERVCYAYIKFYILIRYNLYRDITWEYKGKELTSDIQNNRYRRSINNSSLSIEIFGRKPKLREKIYEKSINNSLDTTVHRIVNRNIDFTQNLDNILNKILVKKEEHLGNIYKTIEENTNNIQERDLYLNNSNKIKSNNSADDAGNKNKRMKRDATVSNDGVLTITKVSKADNGLSYSCIVKSPSGEMAKRTLELIVVEAPQLEEIMLGTDLQESQIVQIHCNLKSGDSPVYYSWLKDGKKIPSNLKVILYILFYEIVVILQKAKSNIK